MSRVSDPSGHRTEPHVQNADPRATADDICEAEAHEAGEKQHMLGREPPL